MAQQQARDEAGNIWNIDEAGNPVSLASAAPQGGPSVVAGNPVQAARQSADLTGAGLGNQKTAQQIALEAAKVPYAPRQAAADTSKAEAEAQAAQLALQKAQREAALPVSGQVGRQNLQRAIDDIKSAFTRGPGRTSGIGGLADYLPTTENQQFNAAGNSVRGFVGPALGLTGGQLNTEKEAQRAVGPYIPQSSDRDDVIRDKIRRLQGLADAMAGGRQAQQSQQPQQAAVAPIGDPNSGNGGSGPAGYDVATTAGITGGGGGGGNFTDAAGIAMAQKMKAAYNRGAGVQEINRLLSDNGYQTLSDPGSIAAIQKRGPINFAPPQADDTRGAVGRALGSAAESPLGSYAISAADALTAGTLDEIAGGQSGLAMDYARDRNPTASLLGSVTGGALAAGGAELGLGAAGLSAGRAALTGDALYGAAYGAGSAEDGSRLAGAALGGAGGLAGGIAGRAAARGIGGALTGVQDVNVRGLRDAGVPLTAGQATGGVLKGVEDRLSGLPIVGDAVNARRLEGMQGFNRAAFDEALAPIGANTAGVTGEAGIDAAQGQVSSAYKQALDGVRVQADAPYTQEMLGTFQQARGLPDPMSARAEYTLNTRVGNSFSDGSPLQRVGENDGWTKYNYSTPNGDIPLEVMPRRQGLEISIDENNVEGANRLGPRQLGEAASYLRSEYPDAKYIYGMRTTGANPGRDQAIDLDRFPIAEPIPGIMTGDGFQQSVRGLRRDAASVAQEPYGYDFGQITGRAESALEGMLGRQAPDVLPAYNNANNAFRKTEILRDAVNRARNGTRVGETGTFAPSQLADAAAANAKRFGNSQGTTRQPFFGLTRAGQAVLPNSVPDSGTAGRAVVAGGLGLAGLGGGAGYAADGGDGAGTGATTGLALAGLLAAGGTRTGQRALVSALLDRPQMAVRAGRAIQNRARLGGLFGAPLLAGAGTALVPSQ